MADSPGGEATAAEAANSLREGLAGASSALMADALDGMGLRHQTLAPEIRPIAQGMRVIGRAVPVAVGATDVVPEIPYRGEMAVVDSLQPGEILVYSVDPGVEAALWGELFSCAAIGRGAVGAIVDGPVRDVALMRALSFPVFARSFSPLDTRGRAEVRGFREPVAFGQLTLEPGDVVVADDDGIVVCPAGLEDEVASAIEARLRSEHGARADLKGGVSIFDVWDRWQAL